MHDRDANNGILPPPAYRPQPGHAHPYAHPHAHPHVRPHVHPYQAYYHHQAYYPLTSLMLRDIRSPLVYESGKQVTMSVTPSRTNRRDITDRSDEVAIRPRRGDQLHNINRLTSTVLTGGKVCLTALQSTGLSLSDRILTVSAMWLLWYALGMRPILLGYEYKRRGVIKFAKDCWYIIHDIDYDFANSKPKSIIELALTHIGIDKAAWYQFKYIAQLLEVDIKTEYVSPYDDLMCCAGIVHGVSDIHTESDTLPMPDIEPRSDIESTHRSVISVEKMMSFLFQ